LPSKAKGAGTQVLLRILTLEPHKLYRNFFS